MPDRCLRNEWYRKAELDPYVEICCESDEFRAFIPLDDPSRYFWVNLWPRSKSIEKVRSLKLMNRRYLGRRIWAFSLENKCKCLFSSKISNVHQQSRYWWVTDFVNYNGTKRSDWRNRWVKDIEERKLNTLFIKWIKSFPAYWGRAS